MTTVMSVAKSGRTMTIHLTAQPWSRYIYEMTTVMSVAMSGIILQDFADLRGNNC